MMNILEELDMMYEVKGDIESSHNKRMALEKDASKRKIGLKKYYRTNNIHDPYRQTNYGTDALKTKDDYEYKSSNLRSDNRARDYAMKREAEYRNYKKSKGMKECTETIDTLEGILA